MASAARSTPKDTACAHDGPKKVDMRLSAMPRMMAATRVPPMLPMPPRTVMAILRHRHDGPSVEGAREEEVEGQGHGQTDQAGHEETVGDADAAEFDGLPDVARLRHPVVHAELDTETHLDD